VLAAMAIALVSADSPAKSEKQLRHVVLFKFKESVRPADAQALIEAFKALPKKIDVITGFEWGTDVGAENLSQGFTHCFLVTFRDTKGRDVYLPHPAHEEFKKLALPLIEKVLVVDYVTQN
jgi:Stress responsive A/B Barrel Domain